MPRLSIARSALIPIVADGAIGDPRLLDGRLVPVLIVDCAKLRALEELVLVHEHTPPGDVIVTWSWRLLSRSTAFLTLHFQRPMDLKVTLPFNVEARGNLVEWIISSRGLYLQPLSSGNAVSAGMGKPKILVEIPASATFPMWDAIHRRSLERRFVQNGLSRAEARDASREYLARMHDLQFRKPPGTSRPKQA